jgi:hypothetical protein
MLLIGKSTISKWQFPIATLNYQRVPYSPAKIAMERSTIFKR